MKKVNVKVIAVVLVILMALAAIGIFGYIVYKNLFAGVESKRLEGVSEHPITNGEKEEVTSVFKGITELESIDITTSKNSKIITIHITLKSDVNFEDVKNICNNAVTKFSEKNLEFYDVEVFIKSNNKESEVYPQIGYKQRLKTSFSW